MPAFSGWQDQAYVPSQSTIVDAQGAWKDTQGVLVATWTATFDTTSTNIAGSLILEFTDVYNTDSPTYVTRLLLPDNAFHTSLSGWARDTGNIGLKLTAGAAQQGCVTLSISKPPVGRVRCRWDATAGGGAGANTLVVTSRAWGP